MNKERRKNLRSVINQCRKILENDIARRISYYGVGIDGKIIDVAKFSHFSLEDLEVRRRLEQAIDKERIGGLSEEASIVRYIRHSGFTYLNRFAALRAMEVRQLIKETIIRRDKYHGRSLREMQLAENDDSLNPEELLKKSLIMAFEEVGQEIRVLFDVKDSYSLVFPDTRASQEVIKLLTHKITENDWLQDDVIGWIYQYYNEELREEFRESKKGKPNAEDIPIITQFYTPDWMVRSIVDNTLGYYWKCMYPETDLTSVCMYYVKRKLRKIPQKRLQDVRILDPACGSGHFLVYAFDVLYELYKNFGNLNEDEIPAHILRHNLYGIDIDLRASQLAALSLYLKAKTYNPKIKIAEMNIVCADIRVTNGDKRKEFLDRFEDDPDFEEIFNRLINDLGQTFSIGSLVQVRKPFEILFSSRKSKEKSGQTTFELTGQTQIDGDNLVGQTSFSTQITKGTPSLTLRIPNERTIEEMLLEVRRFEEETISTNDIGRLLFASETKKSVGLLELLIQKYDIIVMNPPHGIIPSDAKEYVRSHFPRTYYDYYSAFIEQAVNLTEQYGMIGAVTGRPLLVRKVMQKLREEILTSDARPQIILDLGFKTLEEANARFAVLVAARISPEHQTKDDIIRFFSLTRFEWDEKRIAFEKALTTSSDILHDVSLSELAEITGTPYAYWAPHSLRKIFKQFPSLDKDVAGKSGGKKIADVKVGLQTSDMPRFRRFWWEVFPEMISTSRKETSKKKWVPYSTLTSLFYFYADVLHVVNWANDGEELRHFTQAAIRSENFYFRQGITWTSGIQRSQVAKFYEIMRLPFRVLPKGTIFSTYTQGLFPKSDNMWYILSICCSKLIFAASRMMTSENEQGTAPTASLPIPIVEQNDLEESLASLAKEAYSLLREWSTGDEISPLFIKPWLINTFEPIDTPITRHPLGDSFEHFGSDFFKKYSLTKNNKYTRLSDCLKDYSKRKQVLDQRLNEIKYQIDRFVYQLYGISESEAANIESAIKNIQGTIEENGSIENDILENNDTSVDGKDFLIEQVERLLSFYVKKAIENDEDGIVPLHQVFSNNLNNTVRELLRSDFGNIDVVETEVAEILGMSLEEWLRTRFFTFHIDLYWKRPIYWQLTSDGFRKGKKADSSFSCLLHYHKLTHDTIPKIQGIYLPTIMDKIKREKERLLEELDSAKMSKDKSRISRISEQYDQVLNRIDELESFDQALTMVHDPREDKKELKKNATWVDHAISEVRDNGYRPIIDYGVRVNIDPLKELKLLHEDADRVK